MSKQRKTAWQGLNAILLQGQYASLWLRKHCDGLNEDEKRWVTQVIYGVLRQRVPVRRQWEDLVRSKPDEETAILLDLSIYQLFYLDKGADYAIVNDAVSLCPSRKKGLVNAVLREVLRRGRKEDLPLDSVENISIMTSHPQWLLQMWKAHYGETVMRQIALSDMMEASVSVRINPLKWKDSMLEKREGWSLDENGWTLNTTGNPVNDPWLKEGKIVIQDLSSQQVALWLDARPGETVLDACSAPGTKTTQIAAMMQNKGKILACDLHEHRLELVREGAKRCGVQIIETKAMDATCADQLPDQQFDRVLLDVPCSGLGVLSHKPEILIRLSPQSLDEITQLQKQILDTCSPCCKKGGILVYSTCTLNKKENEKQVAAFLKRNPDFELVEEKTFFPFEADQDGFYIAKLRRQH